MNKVQRRRKFIAEHPDHPTASAKEGNRRWRYLLAEENQWRRKRASTEDDKAG
jgi:hypothetical protein